MIFRTFLHSKRDVKKIGLFGLGKSNLALLSALPQDAEITLRSDAHIDPSELPRDARITRIFDGEHSCEAIREDVIIFSPSVRRERRELSRARERGVIFTSDCELFLENARMPIFATSGSDGKSTSATLVSMLLSERFPKVSLCGNIGVPFIKALSAEACSAELSSFQLTYATVCASRAGITNITPNHLNWHSSFEEYKDVKLSLLSHAEKTVIPLDDPILAHYAVHNTPYAVTSTERSYGQLREKYGFSVAYTLSDGYIERCGVPYIPLSSVRRCEKHNIKNLLFALGMCDGYVSRTHAEHVAREFSGLSHRCEHIASFGGVDFINSSIDTTPARCEATLSSLGRECIILLGGRSKGVPFSALIPPLKKYARLTVLFGECREEISEQLTPEIAQVSAPTLEEALSVAIAASRSGDVILLSPAATSYDAYESFEKRGEHFKMLVKEYIKTQKNQQ